MKRCRLVGFVASLCLSYAGAAPVELGAAECPLIHWVQRRFERPMGPGFTPSNVYKGTDSLPADLRRVAVLPLAVNGASAQMTHAQEALANAVGDALSRKLSFEVVTISPETLKRVTGKSEWRANESVPKALFDFLREQKDCQGVVFAELTQFQAYGALQIGWRLRLVDSREAGIYWAADQVFDAGVTSVANAARRFAQDHDTAPGQPADSHLILASPSRFGAYTLAALFSTLPAR